MISEKYMLEKLYLKTITPIFIGQNQANDLSPYSDYVQIGNELIYIDERKFEEALFSKEGLIDKYVIAIRQKIDKSRTRSEFELKSFILNNFEDVYKFVKIKVPVDQDIKHQTIKRFINSSGRPFIPGSSIKGAIRTAIIYDWLNSAENGKKVVIELINRINELYDEKNKLLEKAKYEALTDVEEKRLKDLTKKRKNEEEVDKIYNEKKIFGDLKPFGYDARNIKITDSDPFTLNDISVLKLQRVKLKDGTGVSPIPCETLNPNLEGIFRVKIEKNFNHNELKKFNSYTIGDVFKIINKFSLDSIEYELSSFDESKFSESIDFYKKLKELIINSSNNFAILRLGAGKTYFDNSIGLAIYKTNKDSFKKFRELLELGKNPSSGRLAIGRFPTTRTLIEATKIPIGWIAISNNREMLKNLKIYETKLITINQPAQSPATKPWEEGGTNKPRPANSIIAEIVDENSKPPKVKILEGKYVDEITILPQINIKNLGLTIGSKVYVILHFQKDKIQKAEYKGKVE